MSVGRALRTLLLVSVLLMPFSTGAGKGSVVVAYGLAPLAIVGSLLALALILRPVVPRSLASAWVAGGLLAFALAAGTTYAPRPVESLARSGAGLLGYAAFLFVLSPLYPEQEGRTLRRRYAPRSEDVIWVLVTSGGLLAVYFLVHYALAIRTVGLLGVVLDRVTGGAMSLPWGSSNVVASCFLFPFFAAFYCGRREETRVRRWTAPAARVLMLVAIVATLSRGAIAALLAGALTHLVVVGSGRRRGLLLGILGLLLIAIVADIASGGVLSRQLGLLAASRLERSDVGQLNGRTERWAQFSALLAEAPLIGTGYFGSMTLAGGTAHNLLLTTLVERGVLGTMCSMVVLVLAAWRALAGRLRAQNGTDRLLFACVLSGGAASLIHLMVEDANLTHQYIVFSWLALALPVAAWWERVERRGASARAAAPEPAPALRPG